VSEPTTNPLLSYTPDPPSPEQEAYELHLANRDLWRRLNVQHCDFVRLTISMSMDSGTAREYRVAMGGTLLQLNDTSAVHGHGDFIKRATKLLGCAKSTIYRYMNLYRDAKGIPRLQRAAHLSQGGTNDGGGTVVEEPESNRRTDNMGQICDVKLFFDQRTNELKEWQDAVTLMMVWNHPRLYSPSDVALYCVKKVAAEVKAVRDKDVPPDLMSNIGYVDDEGWTRDIKGNIVERIPRDPRRQGGGMVNLVKDPPKSIADPEIDEDLDGLENVIRKKDPNA
jgi:hypothetical protein